MKKLFSLIVICFLVSCEKSEFDFEKPIEDVQTKASIGTYELLHSLDGVPINIRNTSNLTYRYLSTSKKGRNIDLHTEDDGSGRQKWNMKSGGLNSFGISINGGTQYNNCYMSPNGIYPNKVVPQLATNLVGNNIVWENIPNTNYYNIGMRNYTSTPMQPVEVLYLYAINTKDRELSFEKKGKTGGRDVWEIIVLEEFELIDVKYELVAGDKLNLVPQTIRTRNFEAPSTGSLEVSHEFIEEITETSSFQEVKGLTFTNKISASTGVGVGLPIININGSVSTEQTTTKNWSYTTTQTTSKKKAETITVKMIVPPSKKYTVNLYAYNYQMDLTYIATLRGKTTGKTIKIPGRWSGVECSHLDYTVKDLLTNQIVRQASATK